MFDPNRPAALGPEVDKREYPGFAELRYICPSAFSAQILAGTDDVLHTVGSDLKFVVEARRSSGQCPLTTGASECYTGGGPDP